MQSVTVAGNAVMTALAGWSWQAGTITPFLLTSTDRRSWTPADLPAGLAGYRIVAVAVDGVISSRWPSTRTDRRPW